MENNAKKIDKACCRCGITFQAQRNSAKYCSSACRSLAWKEKDRVNHKTLNESQLLPAQQSEMEQHLLMIHQEDQEAHREELKSLIWSINVGYAEFDEVIEKLQFRSTYSVTDAEYEYVLVEKSYSKQEASPVTVDDFQRYCGFIPPKRPIPTLYQAQEQPK